KETNLFDMNDLLGAVVRNLTVDSTMSTSEIRDLALEFRHTSPGSIHTEVLPTIPEVLPSGADVLQEAQPYDRTMIEKFLAIGIMTSRPHGSTSSSPESGKSSSESTTTTSSSSAGASNPADVVFDTQPEPWNGTPC
ncbi:MAG: hypothetical protein ACLPQS_08655, partial [Acidimicrobiales bacterium]